MLIKLKVKCLSLPDRWILSRLQTTITDMHEAIKNYRFDLYAQSIYEFTWNEFCDWYLELSKPILNSSETSAEQLYATRHTLLTVLESLLRLLHPIMPFVTEEIWQRVTPFIEMKGEKRSIMLQPYPQFDAKLHDKNIEAELDWVKNVVIAVRTIRSEMNIAPGKPLSVLFHKGTELDKKRYEQNQRLVNSLARLESARWLAANETPPESATALVGELEILIPMAGLIDKKEETARLNREIAKLAKETEKAESKLQNPHFVDKAPADVVEKERDKLTELKTTLQKLEDQLKKISAL